nr:MAG TPA: hypothetical protein [Bacteriophage sp.]
MLSNKLLYIQFEYYYRLPNMPSKLLDQFPNLG